MLIKTVIKRCQDFRPPGPFERKLLNEKLSWRQTSLNKFPTAHNSCSLVCILTRDGQMLDENFANQLDKDSL